MQNFEMVAKTLAGLEEVLAEELRQLGAENVMPGKRMVSFEGDLAMLYKANLCCRTALRILKPFYKFTAHTTDELYENAKDYDWSQILTPDTTFCIDTVAYSEDFTHSQFVTYRIKDAIVDWFRDRYGDGQRPSVRLKDADIMINVHISQGNVTLSLDSSGESLHKRGYRVAQTEAPINEVLAAGIILMSGWRGETPLVDPMCGSGTFLIEAALIAANINPGIYRKWFAFESWKDFDKELFESLFNDDSNERQPQFPIVGADISPTAIAIATKNLKSAGVSKYVTLERKSIVQWTEAPKPAGVMVTNPPYGERISTDDMLGLYSSIGTMLKNVFAGYHIWLIGYRDEHFQSIGLAPSQKIPVLNGSLECEIREYVIFEGDKKSFRAAGGRIKPAEDERPRERRVRDRDRDNREGRSDRKFGDRDNREGRKGRKFGDREGRKGREDRDERKERKFGDRDNREERKGREERDERKPERRSGRFTEPRPEDESERPARKFGDREERRERRFGDRDRDRDNREGREGRKFGDREGRKGREDRKFGDRDNREGRKGREDWRDKDNREGRKDWRDRGDREERRERRDRRDRDERRERKFGDRRTFEAPEEQQEPENPLAKRRNPRLLALLENKQPSLAPNSPRMRKRGNRKDDTEE